MIFNFGVVPVKAIEMSYKDSRLEYSVVSWMPAGKFAMATFIKIWMWQLSIASSNSMLKDMNNAYMGALQLLQNDGLTRRLQRTKPFELV
jgi:hypothetical protein